MKKIKNMFGGSKDGNVVGERHHQDKIRKRGWMKTRIGKNRGEIAFSGRLGDFVSPTGDDAVEEDIQRTQ